MVSGRTITFAMLIVGAVLLGGYELVRRSATPRTVDSIEDRGAATGIFDRVYNFAGDRYRVRVGDGEGSAPVGTIIVSTLADDGSDATQISRARLGLIDAAYLLEFDAEAPPKVIVIVRSADENAAAEGIAFTLLDGEWSAKALEPLAAEIRERYLGHDLYEQQGVFLYRTISLEPRIEGGEPFTQQLFYDFHNQRWEAVR